MGEILADAVAGAPGDARAAAERHAFDYGQHLGARCAVRPLTTRTAGSPAAVDDELSVAYAALTDLGFEPHAEGDLSLGNCPFHQLAQRQPELICGLNQSFLSGLLAGLGTGWLRATLAPRPGLCCVRVGTEAAAGADDRAR